MYFLSPVVSKDPQVSRQNRWWLFQVTCHPNIPVSDPQYSAVFIFICSSSLSVVADNVVAVSKDPCCIYEHGEVLWLCSSIYHFQFPYSFVVNVFPIDVCYSRATFLLEMLTQVKTRGSHQGQSELFFLLKSTLTSRKMCIDTPLAVNVFLIDLHLKCYIGSEDVLANKRVKSCCR